MGTFFSRASLIKGLERDGITLIGFAVRCFTLSLMNYKSPLATLGAREKSTQEKLQQYVQTITIQLLIFKFHLCPYGKTVKDTLRKSNAH